MLQAVDRILHEPYRLVLAAYLYSVEKADFTFLKKQTGMTQGNLSSHLGKLEESGYVKIEKGFHGKRPRTMIRMTPSGRNAFEGYVREMKDTFSELEKLVG